MKRKNQKSIFFSFRRNDAQRNAVIDWKWCTKKCVISKADFPHFGHGILWAIHVLWNGQWVNITWFVQFFHSFSSFYCHLFLYSHTDILTLYLKRKLGFENKDAIQLFHGFTMMVYLMGIFGSILSDVWLGKFKTIFYLSFVYVIGSAVVAISAVPVISWSPKIVLIIGLLLIAVGSGGIKPCVSAFGGDQFKLPEQTRQLATFFSLFYFTINTGSIISSSITPILKSNVHCFGQDDCYSLAFGVPAVLMLIAIGKMLWFSHKFPRIFKKKIS